MIVLLIFAVVVIYCVFMMVKAKNKEKSTTTDEFRAYYNKLRKEEIEKVKRALDSLPELHREILILRTYDGASYAEIAEILSVPEGTVMSRLHNARAKLKKRIESMEGAVCHEL